MISNRFDFSAMQASLNSLNQGINNNPEQELSKRLNSFQLSDTHKIFAIEHFLQNGGNPNIVFPELNIGENDYLYPSLLHVVYLYWKGPNVNLDAGAEMRLGHMMDKILNDPRTDFNAKFSEQSLCDCEHFIDLINYRTLQATDGYLIEGMTIAHYALVLGDLETLNKVLDKAPHLVDTTCSIMRGKGLFSKEEYVQPIPELSNGSEFGDHGNLDRIKYLHDNEEISGVVGWGATDRASYLRSTHSVIIRTTNVSLLHLGARLGDESICGYLRGKGSNFAALDSFKRTPLNYFGISFTEGLISNQSSVKKMITLLKSVPRIHQPYLPPAQLTIEREGYQVVYDTRTKVALYAHQRLTRSSLQRNADRNELSFKVDHEIPKQNRAKHADYTNSSFQKGHLVPVADATYSEQAAKDTFYFSNAFPQVSNFNQGCWKTFEKYVRDLTSHYDVVEVFTGPLFLPHVDAYGKQRVSYETIGSGNVAVPTHVFKVLFLHNSSTTQVAYILPNMSISPQTPLSQFQVTLEKIQEFSGILFNQWRPYTGST